MEIFFIKVFLTDFTAQIPQGRRILPDGPPQAAPSEFLMRLRPVFGFSDGSSEPQILFTPLPSSGPADKPCRRL